MNQQHPHQPQQPPQPGWSGPPQPGYGYPPAQPGFGAPAPQPPKKRGVGKIAGLGCAGVLALFVIAAVATGGGGDGSADTSAKDKAVSADAKPKGDAAPEADDGPKAGAAKDGPAGEQPAAQRNRTQAEEFKDCVAKSGTPTEKDAVKHVTKVTGADKRNNILDAAEVFTDYGGGILGPNQGKGKLIASAFTSCYESDNGLVTVYDKQGELLANANY